MHRNYHWHQVIRARLKRLDLKTLLGIKRDLHAVMFLENDEPEWIVGVSMPSGGRVVASCT